HCTIFFFQAEDGIRDFHVTGVQTCALPISWRDPYVYYEPQEAMFYAFITARVKEGDPQGRGCIAAARSEDLVTWEVLPPVVAPRSEERRVGKECRVQWSAQRGGEAREGIRA